MRQATRWAYPAGVGWAFAFWVTGCAPLVPFAVDCEDSCADADNAGGAGGAGGMLAGGSSTSGSTIPTGGAGGSVPSEGNFACLGNVSYPLPQNPTADLNLRAVTVTNSAPIANVTLSACSVVDQGCAVPVAQAVSDARGAATITVPTDDIGFDGLFRATGPKIPNSIIKIYPAIATDKRDVEIPMIDNGALTLLGSLFGVSVDPARGHVAIVAQDCELVSADGVRVAASTADRETRLFYIKASIPNEMATATDATGVAAFFNLPPMNTVITTTLGEDGTELASVPLIVEAGTITYVTLPPL